MKRLKYLILLLLLTMPIFADAKEVKLTCNYIHVYDQLSGSPEIDVKCEIYDDYSHQCYMTIPSKNSTNNEEKIINWGKSKDDFSAKNYVQNNNKCPDYLVVKADSGINGFQLYAMDIYDNASKLQNSLSGKRYIAINKDIKYSDEEKKQAEENLSNSIKELKNEIDNYNKSECLDNSKVINRISECSKVIDALRNRIVSEITNVDNYVKQNILSENDEVVKQFRQQIETTEAFISQEQSFLDNEDKKIKEELEIGIYLSCSYTSSNYDSFDAYPSSNYNITITSDSNGVYFNGNNIIKGSAKLGDYIFTSSNGELNNFLESYKKNGCPNQFFAAGKNDDLQNLYFQNSCAAGDGVNTQCFLYKLNDQNESEIKHTISTSPIYNRYVEPIKKQVQYSFSYDFDSKTSYLEVDGVKYEIKNKSLLESINQTTNAWGIYPDDYDDIFKINDSNKTVDWPELVHIMQKSLDQQQILYFTINTEEYDIQNDFKDESEAKYGEWNPDSLCGEHNENCNIDITEFCINPYVARTLKFLGLLLAVAKILVPAIIIILGFVDLAKIIISGKVDEAKKQAINIGKRIVIGMIIFLIPTILITIYNVASNIANGSDVVSDGTLNVPENFKNCVGCILDATNDDACIVDVDSIKN